MVDMDSPQRVVTSFLTCNKIQDDGRPPVWKTENLQKSAAIWDICTKYGVLVAMDSPQHPLMSFWVTTKYKTTAGRHFEKQKIAIYGDFPSTRIVWKKQEKLR